MENDTELLDVTVSERHDLNHSVVLTLQTDANFVTHLSEMSLKQLLVRGTYIVDPAIAVTPLDGHLHHSHFEN